MGRNPSLLTQALRAVHKRLLPNDRGDSSLSALVVGRNAPGFVHNGPLAGLVAVCAGSDVMYPIGALVVGSVAGVLFVVMFTLTQNKWKVDDVLGVSPLHGLCGAWGGIAAGIFGSQGARRHWGVSLGAQVIGTGLGVGWALLAGFATYGLIRGRSLVCGCHSKRNSRARTCQSTGSARRRTERSTGSLPGGNHRFEAIFSQFHPENVFLPDNDAVPWVLLPAQSLR